MTVDRPNYVDQLRILNLSLRAQLEQAEARIPGINDLIKQLAAIELITESALLGPIIYERQYGVIEGSRDSGQLLQAALLVPSGFGTICWDSEDYVTFRKHPPQNESQIILNFVPFDSCPSAVQALLLPQVEPLLERLFRRFGFLQRNSK